MRSRRGFATWALPVHDTIAGHASQTLTPAHVERRHEINRWIRSHSGAYDGRVDFETVVLDPQWPNWLAPEYDTGDNLHPNNAGLAAMGDSIDLSLFDGISESRTIEFSRQRPLCSSTDGKAKP